MSFNDWVNYKIGDFAEVQNGYAFKSNEFSDVGIPVIKIKNIESPKVNFEDCQYYNGEITERLKQFLVNRNDILISMTGSHLNQIASAVGKVGRYQYDFPALLNQRVGKVYVKEKSIASDDFLYYFLNRFETQLELVSSASGSANQANISPSQIKNLSINLPDLETQSRIAFILSSIDNKIELNNQINQTLEEIGQILFKEWFVKFNFPNNTNSFKESEIGMIPQDWEVVSLADLMEFQGGSQPPSDVFKEQEEEGYIRLIQIRDFDTNAHTTYIPFTNKLKLCQRKDIMIARYGASVGRILFGLEGAYNVALVKVIPHKTMFREFLRVFLKSSNFQERLLAMSGRSAQAGFNKDDFRSFKLAIPSDTNLFQVFENIVSPTLDKILNNNEENYLLNQTRDTLIPKILKGEIEI